jgi:rubrerythrin
MQDSKKKVVDGLIEAIKAERHGHSFFQMAAASSNDPKAKEVFTRLAAEELDHMHFLMKQHESILKTGRPDGSVKLGARGDLSGASPIFSEGIKARIKDAHYEMTALSVGIQLERDAVKFYLEQAAAIDEADIKDFYLELAEWESGHYQALLRQQEELKEDYWSAGGFSPF